MALLVFIVGFSKVIGVLVLVLSLTLCGALLPRL